LHLRGVPYITRWSWAAAVIPCKCYEEARALVNNEEGKEKTTMKDDRMARKKS
jgi:hypothetical protein